MRRGLASLIVALSLIVASLSWAGFTLSRTILDPGRSERLAFQLLDNPEVRDALTSRLADTLESQIPSDVPVPRATVEAGADVALDDPRVRALIVDGFVRVHQNALEGVDEPVVVDAGALGAAGRDALVNTRPELDAFLPAAPSVEVELPTTGLSWMGRVADVVDRFTLLGAIGSLAGLITGFVIAPNRPAVLRRMAYWGYGAAAFWIVVGLAVPWAAGLLSPTSAAIATAAVDVFFGAMIRPAIILAVIATALLVIGIAWPNLDRRRGAHLLQPARAGAGSTTPAAAPAATSTIGTPTIGAATAPPPAHMSAQAATPQPTMIAPTPPTNQGQQPPTYAAAPSPSRPPASNAGATAGSGPGAGTTRSWDNVVPGTAPTPPSAPSPAPADRPAWTPQGSTDQTQILPSDPEPADPEPASPSTAWRAGYGYLDSPGSTQPMPPDDSSATPRFRP